MLIYIHGFGSSGKSGKAMLLRKHLLEGVIAPSLPPIPDLAVDTLEQIVSCIQQCEAPFFFAGSSLGGYYAAYLADKYDTKAVLINPSVKPYRTLAAHIGLNHSYYDFSDYEFTQKHIDTLRKYDVKNPDPSRYLLLLQTGDEVLDYREAVQKFQGAHIDIEEGGSHGYEDFARKIPLIVDFLQR
jgi:predicted esterase YcpF (UPF0227 family)